MQIIEKCNRPNLFMIIGRNGLNFLLRLGQLSYAVGFQSETLGASVFHKHILLSLALLRKQGNIITHLSVRLLQKL